MPSTTDTYTGNVVVGGPPDTRRLANLEITKIAVGPMNNNAYLLQCRSTGDALLIDAANEPLTLVALLHERTGGRLDAVVTTHRHFDHWQALRAIVAVTNPTTFAGRYDADHVPVPADKRLDDGARVMIGDATLDVIHLVGHTPGSIALAFRDPGGSCHLFTGDCLFPGGVGNTRTPEAFDSLMRDVTTKIFERYDDNTWIYPGHGNDTVLGEERPHLEEWRARGW